MTYRAILALLIAGAACGAARADDGPSLNDLDQRIKALESAAATHNAASPSSDTAAVVQVGPGGIGIYSANKTYGLKFGGLVQIDDRTFLNQGPNTTNSKLPADLDEFLPRRIRLNETAYFGPKADVFVQEELNTANPVLLDAYGELKPVPWATLRLGVQKTPLSLERWRADPARDFAEFGYVGNLVTDRDTGAWLEVKDPQQTFYVGAGIFNGSTDTSNPVLADPDNAKDGVAKIFIQPVNGIGAGVAGSAGDHDGSALPSYKSLGQETTIFSLSNTASIKGDGSDYRIIPQAYAYWRQLGLLGEYIHENQGIESASKVDDRLTSEAWEGQASWILTGEANSFTGFRLTPDSQSWGLLALAARVSGANFDVDPNAAIFSKIVPAATVLASSSGAVNGARSYDASLIYVPANGAKLILDYTLSNFIGGGGQDAAKHFVNLPSEQLVTTRAEFYF